MVGARPFIWFSWWHHNYSLLLRHFRSWISIPCFPPFRGSKLPGLQVFPTLLSLFPCLSPIPPLTLVVRAGAGVEPLTLPILLLWLTDPTRNYGLGCLGDGCLEGFILPIVEMVSKNWAPSSPVYILPPCEESMSPWILMFINNTSVFVMIYLFFSFSPWRSAPVVMVGSCESTIPQGGY